MVLELGVPKFVMVSSKASAREAFPTTTISGTPDSSHCEYQNYEHTCRQQHLGRQASPATTQVSKSTFAMAFSDI
jgi:hypothetical protein